MIIMISMFISCRYKYKIKIFYSILFYSILVLVFGHLRMVTTVLRPVLLGYILVTPMVSQCHSPRVEHSDLVLPIG